MAEGDNMRRAHPLLRLRSDQDGAAVMEFGLVSIVFITMLIGMFDIGQSTYAQSVLNGAVQEAARSSSLETANTGEADARVLELMRNVAPGAQIASTRKSYFDFADINRAEKWNDADFDGTCDDGESYTDENGNGRWDADIGSAGNGGAGDVVVYSVVITYDPLFPIPFYDGSDTKRTLSAKAIKKNQPFADQANYGSTAGTC